MKEMNLDTQNKLRSFLFDMMKADFDHEAYYRTILKQAIEEKIKEREEREENRKKRYWRY